METAVGVGKSVLGGALDFAKSTLAEEVALQFGVEEDRVFIIQELEMMQAFLMEAHQQRDDSMVVCTWVKQVRDTAYDVEDSLQDFAVRIDRKPWWLFPCTLVERRRVAKKMKQLRAMVEEVSQRNLRYHLIKGSGSKDPQGNKVFGIQKEALEESQFIGRKEELTQIVGSILNKDQPYKVTSVCGMGGIGKTTLVNAVYQHPKLRDCFEKFVYVTVMHPFQFDEFLRTMVLQLNEQSSIPLGSRVGNRSSASIGTEELARCLANSLQNKNCLIVFDDVSSVQEWDLIKPVVHWMEKSSRIVVTTREATTAEYCSGQFGSVHKIQVLEPDEQFQLFSKKVFGETTYLSEHTISELFNEARHILKQCGGLPLGIVVIGGFLANQPRTPEEWRRLNGNISAEIEMNPELGLIHTVLEKSYNGLPYYLKSCFLYLSIFPKDCIISRRRLVRRWAAEGYSIERRGKSEFETAESYFMQLNNRSMTLPIQKSIDSRKSIDSCKVHDLMHEIALSKAVEEGLVFKLEEGCSLNTHGSIRHLAVSSTWTRDQTEFDSIDLSRVRSLSVWGKFRPFFLSDKMKFLRVLDLEGSLGLDYHDLDNIGKLLHLKYLSLRGCYCSLHLPDSIGNLGQLQTLDIRDTDIIILPKAVTNLHKLQFIHSGIKSDVVAEETMSLIERCVDLLHGGSQLCASCCVPSLMGIEGFKRRDVCTATSACCMSIPAFMTGRQDTGGVLMPRGIRKLKGLRTLRSVDVGKVSVLQDIKFLTGLRKLGVTGVNKKSRLAFVSAVHNLRRLESLFVSAAGKSGLCGCLDGISSPPENLRSLKLYGNLETLPDWIKQLQHLVKLNLGGTGLSKHYASMELLGKLPKLEILGLSSKSFEAEELCFRSPQTELAFANLRVLRLTEITFKSVKFEVGSMPKLEILQLKSLVFKELCFSGLQFLPNMKEVKLCVRFLIDFGQMRNADGSEPKIMEEQRRKVGEFRMKIQEQLAGNPNQPVLT